MENAYQIIKNLRKKAGLKQEDVAKFIDTSRGNYGLKENGKVSLFFEEVISILRGLQSNLPKDALVNGINDLINIKVQFGQKKEGTIEDTNLAVSLNKKIDLIDLVQSIKKENNGSNRVVQEKTKDDVGASSHPPIGNVIRVYNNIIEKSGIELDPEGQQKLFDLVKKRLYENSEKETETEIMDIISFSSKRA